MSDIEYSVVTSDGIKSFDCRYMQQSKRVFTFDKNVFLRLWYL